jgi:hypothetical protein
VQGIEADIVKIVRIVHSNAGHSGDEISRSRNAATATFNPQYGAAFQGKIPR